MARTSDTNSCIMRGKFDWGYKTASGKWSTAQEIFKYNNYRYAAVSYVEDDYPFEVIEKKSKVRGAGHALVLRFESTDGKDFELLGWSVAVEAVTKE